MNENVSANLRRLCSEFARMLEKENVDPDASFADLGADSMLVVEVSLAAEEIYGISIDLEAIELHGEMTLRDFDRQINALGENESSSG